VHRRPVDATLELCISLVGAHRFKKGPTLMLCESFEQLVAGSSKTIFWLFHSSSALIDRMEKWEYFSRSSESVSRKLSTSTQRSKQVLENLPRCNIPVTNVPLFRTVT
jgi:hypothetical protein